MMNLMKYKSVGESGGFLMIRNGLSALLKSPPQKVSSKQLLMVETRLGFSDLFIGGVSAGFSTSAASETVGSKRFFNTSRGAVLDNCVGKSATEQHVSFNQFPGLMVPGMVKNSETRRLLGFNPTSGYFEQVQDGSAAANHDHSHHSELQVPHGHVCRGSAYGWLFLTDDKLDMKLLNPFSGAEIKLPPVKALPSPENEEEWCFADKWLVMKAVFSANPSVEPRPVVLIIYGGDDFPRLAFCKPGDEEWSPLGFPIEQHFHWCYVWPRDAVYHNGQFYVLSHPGYVATFDIRRCIDDADLSVKTTLVATAPKRDESILIRDSYLVMLDGKLVKFEFRQALVRDYTVEEMTEQQRMWGDTTDEDEVFDTDGNEDSETADSKTADSETDSEYSETDSEDGDTDDDDSETKVETGVETKNEESYNEDDFETDCIDMYVPNRTYGIKIRRFDESEKQWVEVESLGDKAVFLGNNTSFALSASDYPAGHCVPNSIYFTCAGGNTHYDMGIYSVEDEIFKPLYLPMPNDDDASQFNKPAPIWIVNSADISILSSGQQSLGDDNGDVNPAPQSKTPAPIQTSSR